MGWKDFSLVLLKDPLFTEVRNKSDFTLCLPTLMENSTSAVPYEWEYYYDYLDPVFVDESKLKYNKCKFYVF